MFNAVGRPSIANYYKINTMRTRCNHERKSAEMTPEILTNHHSVRTRKAGIRPPRSQAMPLTTAGPRPDEPGGTTLPYHRGDACHGDLVKLR